MAFMQNMREYTKVILVILILAFIGTIIFDWGMNVLGIRSTTGIIGEVNGTEINAKQYDEAFARELQSYRDRTGANPPDSQLDFIRNQVWESLIRDILIQEAIQQKGITANNQEIVYHIFNDPPEFLKSQESFQNEQKQFDMALYQSALSNPSYANQWQPIENYIRFTLPYEKFQQRLQASVRVTDDEIKREYLKKNQKAKVKYIFIETKRFLKDSIEISDDMVEDYYDSHKKEFQEAEKRKIQYVIFSSNATAEDSANVWETANSLIERAKQGEDFAELAEIYSEDTGSKDKGGDLGYFGKGAMVKPFEEAAYSAKTGDIVGPVVSNFGIHIIKVADKRIQEGKEEVKASHILLKYEATQKTINTARDDAVYLAEEAKERPLEEIVTGLSQDIQTTEFFSKGNGFIPGIGLNKRASNFIFSNNPGKVSNAEDFPQGFFVFKISEIQKERIKPLEEVKQAIIDKSTTEKRMTMAGELAQKLYEKTQVGVAFEEIASQDSLEIKETNLFNRTGYVPVVGREAKFIGNAFALEKINDVAKPVEATRGYYLLQLMEKTEFDSTDFNSNKDNLAVQLLQQKQNQAFANWYASVKAKADIKDDREKYY